MGGGKGTGPGKTPLEQQLLGSAEVGSRGRVDSCNPSAVHSPLSCLKQLANKVEQENQSWKPPGLLWDRRSPGHGLRCAGTPAIIRADTIILRTLMFSDTSLPVLSLECWCP